MILLKVIFDMEKKKYDCSTCEHCIHVEYQEDGNVIHDCEYVFNPPCDCFPF